KIGCRFISTSRSVPPPVAVTMASTSTPTGSSPLRAAASAPEAAKTATPARMNNRTRDMGCGRIRKRQPLCSAFLLRQAEAERPLPGIRAYALITSVKRESEMQHPVVSREEWLEARKALLLKEKEESRMRDAVNAARMALPWVKIDKAYVFDTP